MAGGSGGWGRAARRLPGYGWGVLPRLLPPLLAALLAGCAAQRVALEKSLAAQLVSDEQEKRLGLQVQADLEKNQKVRYLDDPLVKGYVDAVAARLLPLAERDRPGLKWTVRVIDGPTTVNAFATPGGFLYVYSGLLLAAADTAEVAGVLAHEAGHVVARHSARQMVAAKGMDFVSAVALGKNPGAVAQAAAAYAGKGALLAYGRSEELEADEYGVRYSGEAGYDPRGIATFFGKLQAQEKDRGGLQAWLSTHPPTPERVKAADALAARLHLEGRGGRDPAPLEQVKARLRELHPPEKAKAAAPGK